MVDAGWWCQVSGWGMQDAGCGIQDSGCGMLDALRQAQGMGEEFWRDFLVFFWDFFIFLSNLSREPNVSLAGFLV